MEGDIPSLEEMEEYHMVVTQMFGSQEDTYEYYNSYASWKGFSVRKDDVKYMGGTNIVVRRRFCCSKEGYRLRKYFEASDQKREPRALTRCGCNVELEIERNADTGQWFVRNFVDRHNHPLAKSGEVCFLRSHRRLNDAQKADAIDYGIGGLRPCEIMEVMEKGHGGFDKVGFVSRDLYNFFARYKKKRILGSDAEFMLNHMRAQVERDSEFFFKHTVDDEGRLKNIFWADAQSRIDYAAFGDVVVFDSTYRVNRYNLPFVPFVGVNHHRSTVVFRCGIISDETTQTYEWLLQTFLEAMRFRRPKSVITDGDAATRKAIRRVMPGIDHRLCSWHIEQNMVRHLRNPTLSDFRKFVYYPMRVCQFEKSWAEFQQKHNIAEDNAWINGMYKLRKMWAAAYTNGRYFLGMLSNQRSESLNSRLHKNLDRMMLMVDLMEHYEHCLSRMRRNEAEFDAHASQSVPFTRISAHPLEKNAARIYTPAMFKKVKECIMKASARQIASVTEEDGLISYVIAFIGGTHRFIVRCDLDGSLVNGIFCNCRKMQSEDIPCAHIFVVLKYLGLDSIPRCCVVKRWTMEAKAAFMSDRSANTHVWSEQMERYRQLRNKASVALFKASKSTLHSQQVNDLLQVILDEPTENDENTTGTTFGPLPAHYSCSSQPSGPKVLDPVPIVPKGAPSKDRWKPFHETFKPSNGGRKTRTCSMCGSTNHDRRTCDTRRPRNEGT